MDQSEYQSHTWRKFFAPFRNVNGLEKLEKKHYKVSFLGGSFSEAYCDEQVEQYPLGVRGRKLSIPTITFAMIVTNPSGRVVDSKKLLPKQTFASKDVEVSERSIFFTETESSKEYSILTLSTELYEINIVRASNLYLGEVTPYCVHLPSELWQLIANSENDIKDFGSGLPVRTSILGKSAEHVGKNLTPKEYDPMFLVPDINTRQFKFGVHFGPPQNRPGNPARMFYAMH